MLSGQRARGKGRKGGAREDFKGFLLGRGKGGLEVFWGGFFWDFLN